MIDRIFAATIMLVALIYGLLGLHLKVPFAYDPLGPKPLPLIFSGLLLSSAFIILVRPSAVQYSPKRLVLQRFIYLLTIVLFYHATWTFLGFLLSTTISSYMVSRLFNCTWMQGIMTALVLSVVCYGLFNFILHISLPLGVIFSYTGK